MVYDYSDTKSRCKCFKINIHNIRDRQYQERRVIVSCLAFYTVHNSLAGLWLAVHLSINNNSYSNFFACWRICEFYWETGQRNFKNNRSKVRILIDLVTISINIVQIWGCFISFTKIYCSWNVFPIQITRSVNSPITCVTGQHVISKRVVPGMTTGRKRKWWICCYSGNCSTVLTRLVWQDLTNFSHLWSSRNCRFVAYFVLPKKRLNTLFAKELLFLLNLL